MWKIGDVQIAPVERIPAASCFYDGYSLSDRIKIEHFGAGAELRIVGKDRTYLRVKAPAVRIFGGADVLILPKGEYRYWWKASTEAREKGERDV